MKRDILRGATVGVVVTTVGLASLSLIDPRPPTAQRTAAPAADAVHPEVVTELASVTPPAVAQAEPPRAPADRASGLPEADAGPPGLALAETLPAVAEASPLPAPAPAPAPAFEPVPASDPAPRAPSLLPSPPAGTAGPEAPARGRPLERVDLPGADTLPAAETLPESALAPELAEAPLRPDDPEPAEAPAGAERPLPPGASAPAGLPELALLPDPGGAGADHPDLPRTDMAQAGKAERGAALQAPDADPSPPAFGPQVAELPRLGAYAGLAPGPESPGLPREAAPPELQGPAIHPAILPAPAAAEPAPRGPGPLPAMPPEAPSQAASIAQAEAAPAPPASGARAIRPAPAEALAAPEAEPLPGRGSDPAPIRSAALPQGGPAADAVPGADDDPVLLAESPAPERAPPPGAPLPPQPADWLIEAGDQPPAEVQDRPDASPEAGPAAGPDGSAAASGEGGPRMPGRRVGTLPGLGSAPAPGSAVARPRGDAPPGPVPPLDGAGPAPGAAEDPRALSRYAAGAQAVPGQPLMALVLLDEGGALPDPEALAALPFRLSFAVSGERADAAEAMRIYRSAGHEVVILAPLPEGATPVDAAVAFAGYFAALPEAVAVMEARPGGLQASRQTSAQVVAELAPAGLGLLVWESGLGSAGRLAEAGGVPYATVFRQIDAEGQDARAVGRFIDQAAFRAGQLGGVVLVGRLRAETLEALAAWRGSARAGTVSLVPLSRVLLAQ